MHKKDIPAAVPAPRVTLRQKKAQKTRKALFDHAIRLFREKGFNNVHVDEIAMSASTAKGTFYTYFKSKDDVIIQHYSHIDEVYVKQAAALPPDTPTRDKILRIFEVGLHFIASLGHEFSQIIFVHQLSQEKGTKVMIQESRYLHAILRGFIEEGRARGELRQDMESTEIFTLLICLLRGICLDWTLMDGAFDLEAYGRDKFLFALKAMQA